MEEPIGLSPATPQSRPTWTTCLLASKYQIPTLQRDVTRHARSRQHRWVKDIMRPCAFRAAAASG